MQLVAQRDILMTGQRGMGTIFYSRLYLHSYLVSDDKTRWASL